MPTEMRRLKQLEDENGNPKLVGAVEREAPCAVWKDRLIVIAIGRGNTAAPMARLKIMLLHQALDALMVGDDPLMAKCGLHAAPAIGFNSSQIAVIADSSLAASVSTEGASSIPEPDRQHTRTVVEGAGLVLLDPNAEQVV